MLYYLFIHYTNFVYNFLLSISDGYLKKKNLKYPPFTLSYFNVSAFHR